MASDGEKGAASSIEFKRFDIVSDVSDHHYIDSNKSGKERNSFTSGSVHRKIMKEWKILESDLPDSIYVRVFGTRIDLLRAVIIGASGTPYHDGLFFFDICFPSDYPSSPPKVYYHSHGLRLNPNLYATGYVCLSLINTWSGQKQEKWTPSESTILQLLVSIQGLVLNENPYFNEPGYAVAPDKRTPGVVKRSMDYNDKTFPLSCKTMLYKMQNPPKHFESFVSWHFQMRAKHILAATEAYLNGLCLVGHYEENCTASSKPHLVSRELKVNLQKIYPELQLAFSKIEKTAQMVGTFERVESVSPTNGLATQFEAKIEKTAQIVEKSEGVENVSPSKGLATQSEAKIEKTAQMAETSEKVENVSATKGVATQFEAKIPSSSAQPESVVGNQKGSEQKGVWQKFIGACACIFPNSNLKN